MTLIRHKATLVELDVPDEALPFFPDYEPVKSEAPAGDKRTKAAEATTPKE